MKQMDEDKDGVVDKGEFIARGGKKGEFDRYDRNAEGSSPSA